MDIDSLPGNIQYPHSVSIAGVIVVALLAAEQGVTRITTMAFNQGNLAQDLASARLVRRITREYLDRFGYKKATIPGVFIGPIPIFPYPQDMGWASGFLNYSAMVAALREVEGVFLRTIDEGAGIPVKEAHSVSYWSAKWIYDVLRPQKLNFDSEQIRTEERITELEVRAMMDKILELGDGDVAVGYELGVQTGVIDLPFCGNVNLKGDVLRSHPEILGKSCSLKAETY